MKKALRKISKKTRARSKKTEPALRKMAETVGSTLGMMAAKVHSASDAISHSKIVKRAKAAAA
ncbi:MAG TPA: hypothetical protein VKU42_05020 [Candidatus Angelobacter sp.]|nr:hypothetical protein [Candidatus Angelobacter sp.]